ncbi:YheC/YheD family protein [Paenibacillus sp. NPDC058910]|uniref:YheC/YheD family protein n=1 Tax=unclassified Paenibacillus TaxID=185978 RepID=UPI0036766BBD
MKTSRFTVKSKWTKTKLLQSQQELAKLVPPTQLFSRRHLFDMLERYGMVYVKPDAGSQGKGVMRVEKKGAAYQYQNGIRTLTCRSYRELCRSLSKQIDSKRYLIQRGIHLLTYDHRPFDLRVMIQRNPEGEWEATGTVGRVAHPRKAVTNGSQGGTIYAADRLIRASADDAKTNELLQEIDRIALAVAAHMSHTYPALNELGLDLAVDRDLTLWILEVNTLPDPCPFTKLKEKDTIERIVSYGKAYGRYYPLNCKKSKQGM